MVNRNNYIFADKVLYNMSYQTIMSQKNDTVKRDNRFDFYKGVLIFGVTYGHVLTILQNGAGSAYAIHRFIRTYDMPMFSFISGFFLYTSLLRNTLKTNILNKIGGILLPSLLWEYVPCFLTGRFHIVPSGFWFTYSLFSCLLIVIVIESLLKHFLIKTILYGLVILIFHTIIIDRYKIGFLLCPCIVGYYYHLLLGRGYLQDGTGYIKATVVLLFITSWCFWKADYNVWNAGCSILKQGEICNQMFKILFRFAIGILGTFSMLWFFDIIYSSLNVSNSFNQYITNNFVIIGKVTIELYILQCCFVRYAAKIVKNVVELLSFNPFVYNESLLVLIIAPLFTVIALYGFYYLQVVLKKLPLIGNYCFAVPLKDIF